MTLELLILPFLYFVGDMILPLMAFILTIVLIAGFVYNILY